MVPRLQSEHFCASLKVVWFNQEKNTRSQYPPVPLIQTCQTDLAGPTRRVDTHESLRQERSYVYWKRSITSVAVWSAQPWQQARATVRLTWVGSTLPLHGIACGAACCNNATNICQRCLALWRAQLGELIGLQARRVDRHQIEKGRAVGDGRVECFGTGVADISPVRATEPVESLRLAQRHQRSQGKVWSIHAGDGFCEQVVKICLSCQRST